MSDADADVEDFLLAHFRLSDVEGFVLDRDEVRRIPALLLGGLLLEDEPISTLRSAS